MTMTDVTVPQCWACQALWNCVFYSPVSTLSYGSWGLTWCLFQKVCDLLRRHQCAGSGWSQGIFWVVVSPFLRWTLCHLWPNLLRHIRTWNCASSDVHVLCYLASCLRPIVTGQTMTCFATIFETLTFSVSHRWVLWEAAGSFPYVQ